MSEIAVSNTNADQNVAKGAQEEANGKDEWYNQLFDYFIKAIYEFAGIFFFVMTIYFTKGDINKFIFGFWVILTFFGGFTGGHVNPAVSFGLYIYEGDWVLGFFKMIFYWTAHFFGAAFAAKFSFYLTHQRIFVAVPPKSDAAMIITSEFLFTGTFVFVILFVCSQIMNRETKPPINCAVIVGWFYCAVQMGANLSGAAYNPAILLALNSFEYFQGNAQAMTHVPSMMIAELLGALTFSIIFKYIFERAYVNLQKK